MSMGVDTGGTNNGGDKKLESKKESTEESYIFPENSITQMSFV